MTPSSKVLSYLTESYGFRVFTKTETRTVMVWHITARQQFTVIQLFEANKYAAIIDYIFHLVNEDVPEGIDMEKTMSALSLDVMSWLDYHSDKELSVFFKKCGTDRATTGSKHEDEIIDTLGHSLIALSYADEGLLNTYSMAGCAFILRFRERKELHEKQHDLAVRELFSGLENPTKKSLPKITKRLDKLHRSLSQGLGKDTRHYGNRKDESRP